jgi:long-chain fatty acid transport protein
MSSTQGDVALDGIVGFPDATTSQLDVAIDVDLETIRYPQAGVAWTPTPWLTLAAPYRGGFRLVLDQTFDITGDIGTPGFDPLVDDAAISTPLAGPGSVPAGPGHGRGQRPAHAAPDRGLRSRLAPLERVREPGGAHRDRADIGDFNDLVNIPPQDPLPAPHFHDIAVPHLGVEWLASASRRRRWLARGGYIFEPSPVPPQFGTTNYIDNDKHTLSAGATVELPGLGGIILRPVSFDVSLMATFLPERSHEKVLAADPVGDFRSRGVVIAGALASRWRF